MTHLDVTTKLWDILDLYNQRSVQERTEPETTSRQIAQDRIVLERPSLTGERVSTL
jgi:hypothetical protein